MTCAEALDAAEKLIARIAPTTNARGYSDGVAPLEARVTAILRVADFLATTTEIDIMSNAGQLISRISNGDYD